MSLQKKQEQEMEDREAGADCAGIAGFAPVAVKLKKGQQVSWCRCGWSVDQPFCDASHEGSSFGPMSWQAPEDDKYFFCQCKRSKTPPFCDGSHKKISQGEIDRANGVQRQWVPLMKHAPETWLQSRVINGVAVLHGRLNGHPFAFDWANQGEEACVLQYEVRSDGAVFVVESEQQWRLDTRNGIINGDRQRRLLRLSVRQLEDAVEVELLLPIVRA